MRSRTPEPAHRPMYARLLKLRHVAPSGFLCFVFLEGAVALGVLLALAELVSWWGVVVLPLMVALAVKLNDAFAGALSRSASPSATPFSRSTALHPADAAGFADAAGSTVRRGPAAFGGSPAWDDAPTAGVSAGWGGTAGWGDSATAGGSAPWGEPPASGGSATAGGSAPWGEPPTSGASAIWADPATPDGSAAWEGSPTGGGPAPWADGAAGGGPAAWGENPSVGGSAAWGDAPAVGGSAAWGDATAVGGSAAWGDPDDPSGQDDPPTGVTGTGEATTRLPGVINRERGAPILRPWAEQAEAHQQRVRQSATRRYE